MTLVIEMICNITNAQFIVVKLDYLPDKFRLLWVDFKHGWPILSR